MVAGALAWCLTGFAATAQEDPPEEEPATPAVVSPTQTPGSSKSRLENALYVYAGDMAGDLSGVTGRPAKPPWQWTVEALGFAATIVLVVFITRRAQRILSAKLEDHEPDHDTAAGVSPDLVA